MTTPPRVSIGLPVYNGSRYIREAVAAHLSQTWEDFELIISDNTSTDDTFDICTQYARQDKRVRVIRQPRNCGVNRNHLHVFHMARGEYFRWAAVDDIPSGDLVRHAVSVLDEDPALVAYVPESANIDEAGEMLRRLERTLDIRDPSPVQRASAILTRDYQMIFAQGLMRRSTLLSTSRRWTYFGWDFILLLELAICGPICQIEGPLLYRRLHRHSAAHCTKNIASVRAWVDPTVRSRILLPHWKWAAERMRAVSASRVSIADRLRLMHLILTFACQDRYALKRDILMAVKVLAGRSQEYPF